MFLVQLIYVSKISHDFGPEEIESILSSAKKNNKKTEVTGVLCFNRKYFLQCLEGYRSAVNQTYHKILQDPRHHDIVLLDYQEIVSREFSDWGMGYIPETSLSDNLNLKYSGGSNFDPFRMSGRSCRELMMELSRSFPVL